MSPTSSAHLLGQRVIVENKPAAAGMLATRDVLAQPKDGYNLLLCTHFESINRAVYRNAQFELSDLAPISLISKYYYGLALANAVPATDLAGFIAYAKAHPGAISYGTIGTGSAQEIFARQLERLAGITMNRVPYRGGAQAMQDLLPGRLQFFVSPMLSIIPHANDGTLKILGVSSAERLAAAPNVPTLREQGIDFVRFGWLGICAAAGTPAHDHRSPAQAHRGDRRFAGLPRRDRARRLDPGRIEPGGAAPDHPADPRRRRSDDPGVRAAAGAVSAATRRRVAAAAPIEKSPCRVLQSARFVGADRQQAGVVQW